MLKFVLDLFFPPVCGICGKFNSDWLCDECKSRIYELKKTTFINTFGKKYKEFGYIFLYQDIRKYILDYKFNNKAYLGNMFAKIILDDQIVKDELTKYDMIIPVPMNRKKKAKRGYNQTELIAKILAKELKIEYNNKSLVKIRNNKTQSSLKEKERLENVKNVFEIKDKKQILNKNIILFDDIVTTGATIDECSKVLKKKGVNDIVILSLAKD